MVELIHQLIAWIGSHPHAAGVIVALVACAESLAFVGLIVPGVAMMLGAGALVGAGVMAFWSTLAWAVAGAVIGDGVSYWLGRHYRNGLRRLRPLQAHPELLARGEAFFHRHGGKSILLARFVGPVRPVVPVIAGMLGMAPTRFYVYNLLSALVWAPAHLLPGMAFGASLALAGRVAARLAFLLSMLSVSGWMLVWLVRASYRRLQPHAAQWARGAMLWGRTHGRLAWLVADLVDPARPVSRALFVWLVLLIAGSWLFFGVLEDVLSVDPLVQAGQSFYHLLQQLRTPLGDRIMVVLTELGDAAVAIPLVAAALAWLLWRRAWRDALYWLAAVGFGALAVAAVKLALQVPRPVELYSGLVAYSFPSGHAAMSTVIYGFLAVLSAPSFGLRARWIPYAAATLLVGGIAFSRLYLGAHWLADVAAGVGLGTAWVAVLAIARERHRRAPAQPEARGLATVAVLVFLGAGIWHVHIRLQPDLERYAVRHPVLEMSAQQWWERGWRKLPAYRLDLEGEQKQPLNVQWAGELPPLRKYLLSEGWREAPALTPRTALRWLLPNPSLDQLPLLPQLHDGQYESLLLVRTGEPATHPGNQIVLRLWPTNVKLQPGNAPVWVGTIDWQRIRHLPLVSFPRSAGGYDEAVWALRSMLKGARGRVVQRLARGGDEDMQWGSNVLLATSERNGASPAK